MNKFLATSVLFISCSALSGCLLSQATEEALSYKVTQHYETVQQDQIIGMGLASQNGEQKGLIFVGKNYQYLVKNDTQRLQNILKDLPANERVLGNSLPLKFELNDNQHSFQGIVTLYYPTPKDKISPEKAQYLKLLNMNDSYCTINGENNNIANNYYCAKFDLKGEIYQGNKMDEKQINYRFKTDIPIIIEKEIFTKHQSTGNKIARHTILPLAVILDVVLFPVELAICDYRRNQGGSGFCPSF